jgi:hypothetical protein
MSRIFFLTLPESDTVYITLSQSNRIQGYFIGVMPLVKWLPGVDLGKCLQHFQDFNTPKM